jgi:lysozyme
MIFSLLISGSSKLVVSGLMLIASYTGYNTPTPTLDNNEPKTVTNNTSNSSSLKGIDVSRWQKEVDWMLVKEADVKFAFVKATQGDFRKDPYFARNWEETKRHGIKRGAYHFFKPEAPVQGQIDLFLSIVNLEPGDLPPVLDVEVSDSRVSSEDLRKSIKTWLEAVSAHYGVKPIIYTSQNYYRRYLQGYFPEYLFWIARYSENKPEIHSTDSWMFWQYTDRGSVAGINSAVDINFFAGDFETLAQLCLQDNTISKESPLQQLKHMYPKP